MGNSQPESQKFSQTNWRRINSASADIQVFQNANDRNIHIEQHHIETISQQDFEKVRDFSYLRKNNPRWVSALYFEDTQDGHSEFCATKYQADLYLESIPVRLCNIRSIPFPDALHLYDQALNGYCQFARNIGCFIVESDYIGINQRGVVKVWAGSRWEEVSVKGNSTTEMNMVKSIVNCLEECIDRNSFPPQYSSIGNFLYRNSPNINFETALAGLKNYAISTNKGSIPTHLNSIQDTPAIYDHQKQKSDQFYQQKQMIPTSPVPIPVRYYSPQPYGVANQPPIPPVRREQQLSPEQMESMRRVNSLSNLPVYPQPPRIVNHQEIRTIGNASEVTRPIMDRSYSNPQLLSGSQLRPSLSSKQIVVQSINPSINGRFASGVTEVRPIAANPYSGPRPTLILQGSGAGNLNEQSKSLSIIRQQQLVIFPPSQTEIPKQPLAQQIQTSSRRQVDERGHNEQPSQSIIMQLSKSQANNPFQVPNEIKYSENPNNSSVRREFPTTILKDSQSSFKSTPTNQFDNKYFTPIGVNKKEISNLNSIEQVQTEHYWKDNSSKKSQNKPEYNNNSEPYSLSSLKENYKVETKDLTFNNKYAIINSNDGKTSEDFLQKLKGISTGFNTSSLDNPSVSYEFNTKKYDDFVSSTADYGFGVKDYTSKLDFDYKLPKNVDYNYSFERKKDFDFSDAFNTESVVKQTSYDFGYKPYDYKPSSQTRLYQPAEEKFTDFQAKYSSKYAFGASSNYSAGIDPEILEDLKKNKE